MEGDEVRTDRTGKLWKSKSSLSALWKFELLVWKQCNFHRCVHKLSECTGRLIWSSAGELAFCSNGVRFDYISVHTQQLANKLPHFWLWDNSDQNPNMKLNLFCTTCNKKLRKVQLICCENKPEEKLNDWLPMFFMVIYHLVDAQTLTFVCCFHTLQGSNVVEDQDLLEIGILNSAHRQRLLQAIRLLPRVSTAHPQKIINSNVCSASATSFTAVFFFCCIRQQLLSVIFV